MEDEIKILDRGKLELKNSNIKCFLGNHNNYIVSEEIYKELKSNESSEIYDTHTINNIDYTIYYPIPEKKISIITNSGKVYKSIVYFVDDIKNIIIGLNISNPYYLIEGQYIAFKTENDYAKFLFNKYSKEIKDIETEQIDYIELKKDFENFHIKKSNKLLDINKNIFLYSKIDKIGEKNYFMTTSRTSLFITLDDFFLNKNRNEIKDVIYGILGNYGSGKSFFLINYNYKTKSPSVYLNLKALRNAFRTNGFANLLNNELMILFHKLKKNYQEFENFIKSFLPYENQSLGKLIISIIEKIKKENAIIILDQYQEKIFLENDFIEKLKIILFDEDSKIKVIISSSMNDGPIKKAYLNIFLTNPKFINNNNRIKNEISKKEEKNKMEIGNKTNKFIPYHFLERLVEIDDIKNIQNNIISTDKEDIAKEETFNKCLKSFNYLPLYFDLCTQHIKNLDNFMKATKDRIQEKILKLNDNKINLTYFDNIRKLIDNEITINNLEAYYEYIPFKYFYIEKSDTKLILRTHFPLVAEVWNRIIMKETVNLFDGELNYDGNVIGSLIELNIIINLKDKVIPLDIDNFVKVDTIYNCGKIIESDTNNFKNKNILITQNNQNGPFYDIAYIQGKNIDSPILSYIQVKKSLSDNKIDKQIMYSKFEEKKENFSNLFNFIPESKNIKLFYISLINKKIRQALLIHKKYKNDKSKKVSDLGNELNSLVYSLNALYNFCNEKGIQLYYYDPKEHKFYIKSKDDFIESKLDLSIEYKNELIIY